MQTIRQSTRLVALLATAALSATFLTACGGGDDDAPAAPAPEASVPAAVGDSVSALTDFATQQPPSETDEPLLLGNVVPATDDTAEPTPL